MTTSGHDSIRKEGRVDIAMSKLKKRQTSERKMSTRQTLKHGAVLTIGRMPVD